MTDERPAAPRDEADDTLQDPSTPDPTEAPELTPETGRRRPPIAVMAASILLLVAIGAGLAFAVPPRAAPAPTPAVTPGGATTVQAPPIDATTGQPTVPTALPLSEAIGEPTSTEVVAEVGASTITRGDFVRNYQPGADPDDTLKQLIQIELVVQAAASEGVAVDDAAVTQEIDELKQTQAGGDEARFQELLQQAQLGGEADLRQLLGRRQLIDQMVLRHTTAEQARARHILLATESPTDTVKLAELKVEAEGLIQQLDGGADFAALAASRSDDPGSKENGGDLGWAPRGLFIGPFDEAVFSMQVGERRLVQTDFGWHIIELLNAPEVRTFESPDLIQTQPGQQAFAETFIPWVEGLEQEATAANRIKILIPGTQLVTTAGQ